MKPALLCLFLTFLLAPLAASAESRIALIVGVETYGSGQFQSLPGIKTDVALMSKVLKQTGFEVTVVTDPSLLQAESAIDEFGAKLKLRQGVGLFYFSGHGGEYEGKNYLIPRGARIGEVRDIKEQAVAVQRVLNRMEAAGSRANLVFLDCCRNELTKAAAGNGLAAMSALGTFIGFATAAEKTAAASEGGSPYTRILAKNILRPGVSILDMHTLVTAEVQDHTREAGEMQTPFSYSGLRSAFYFVEQGRPAAFPAPPVAASGADERQPAGSAPDHGGVAPSVTAMPAPNAGTGSATLRRLIRKGAVLVGNQYERSDIWPFKLQIDSFNEATGEFQGRIEYTSLGSTHAVEGLLVGDSFGFRETTVLRQGRALPDTSHSFRLAADGTLQGKWNTLQRMWADWGGGRKREIGSGIPLSGTETISLPGNP